MKTVLIIIGIFFITSCQLNKTKKERSTDDTTITEILPEWVIDIITKDNLTLGTTLDINPNYHLIDIDGDDKDECVIITNENMLVFHKNSERTDKIAQVYSVSVFGDEEKMDWKDNVSWIKEWKILDHETTKERIEQMEILDVVLGDGIYLIAPDGKITMYFDGKHFKWLFYDQTYSRKMKQRIIYLILITLFIWNCTSSNKKKLSNALTENHIEIFSFKIPWNKFYIKEMGSQNLDLNNLYALPIDTFDKCKADS